MARGTSQGPSPFIRWPTANGQSNPCLDGCVLPTSLCPSLRYLTDVLPEAGLSAREQVLDLRPAVTIKAPARGDFGGQCGLEPNKIFALGGNEPDFVIEFRRKLRQRRWIESHSVCIF